MSNYYRPVIAGIGDTLYILFGESIYTMKAGQESPLKLVSGLAAERYSNFADAKARLNDKADTVIYTLLTSGDTL